MAQLTMQRHNPLAHEGRVSISQSSETKSHSSKSFKNDSSDPFQKNIPKRSEPEVNTKKLSERGLKRSAETNDTKSDPLSNKKLKPLPPENHSERSTDQHEASLPLSENESSQNMLTLISISDETTEIKADLFQEHEEVKPLFHPHVSTSVSSDLKTEEQLQRDLATIASLHEQSFVSVQEDQKSEREDQVVQADHAPEINQNIEESKEDISTHQIANSLLSASLIDNNKQNASEKTANASDKGQVELPTLFSLKRTTDDTDLKEISELKVDDAEPRQEPLKRKKSKEIEDTRPKQLSFSFIEQPPQDLKVANEKPAPEQKPDIEIETDALKTQQEIFSQGQSADTDMPDQSNHTKGFSAPSEPSLVTSSNDKLPQSFGIPLNSDLTPTGSMSTVTSPAPSFMPAPHQAAPEQVAVKLITALNNGNDQIHIRLTPEDLGEITIKLNISDNRVNALIQSDNAETLKLLQKDSQTLENALKDSGFTLESHNMEFAFSGGQSRQDQAILQNDITQLGSSLLDDDMLTSLTELAASDAQGRDYILTPTKVDIHI